MNTTKVERVAAAKNYGRFEVEPLEPGFGVTVGNAMRRVLLSSLPGAAITSVRIDGVYHEFSDIANVKEDTTELILNLKQIRLRSFSDRPVRMMLEATGPGRVTAADILAPSDVEIVNPEQHIATLDSPEAKLTLELTVEKGKGYVPAEGGDGLGIGYIPVDALYTPVRKVNYNVEHTRVGQVTDYDRLVMEVVTDGSITPEDAISQAAEILVSQFALLSQVGGKAPAQIEKQAPGIQGGPQMGADVPIEDLDLSVRAYNCLKRVGITKVGQVQEMTEDDLLGVRNFGRKSLDELREKLETRGYLAGSRLEESPSEAESAEAVEEGEQTPTETEPGAEGAPEGEQEQVDTVEQEEEQPQTEVVEETPAEEPQVQEEETESALPGVEGYDPSILEELEAEEQEELGRKKKRKTRRER
jgi:DNA-directed RNA polymerase subunit alpha